MTDLIEFYGTECSHCIDMQPLLEKLKEELKVEIDRKEVWHDAANQSEFMKIAEGKCQGVPFFFNKKTGKHICGATSYEKLKEWAQK